MMEDERETAVVLGLIEKATNSTAAEVDPRLLKAIKSVVRDSDSELLARRPNPDEPHETRPLSDCRVGYAKFRSLYPRRRTFIQTHEHRSEGQILSQGH